MSARSSLSARRRKESEDAATPRLWRFRGIWRCALTATWLLACGGAVSAAERDSVAVHSAEPPLFGRRDAWYALGAASIVTSIAFQDRWLTEEATEGHAQGDRRVARATEHFGNPLVLGPTLLGVDLVGRLAGRPGLSAATERVALSTAVATILTAGLKPMIGRSRPSESPGDAAAFRPFSTQTSFPSGHATVAFAAAAALDEETEAAWVPWVAYPIAASVAWSRVSDKRHWTSDVVAGAAIGAWVGHKVDRVARARLPHGLGIRLTRHGAAASIRF